MKCKQCGEVDARSDSYFCGNQCRQVALPNAQNRLPDKPAPKFKPGDRVRTIAGLENVTMIEGEVVEVQAQRPSGWAVFVMHTEHGLLGYSDDELELVHHVSTARSPKFKPGDRVSVCFEKEAACVLSGPYADYGKQRYVVQFEGGRTGSYETADLAHDELEQKEAECECTWTCDDVLMHSENWVSAARDGLLDTALQMHFDNVSSGGHNTPEEFARCLHRTELHLAWLEKYERDMAMLASIGPEFGKTREDYPLRQGTFSTGNQWPAVTFESVKKTMADIKALSPGPSWAELGKMASEADAIAFGRRLIANSNEAMARLPSIKHFNCRSAGVKVKP